MASDARDRRAPAVAGRFYSDDATALRAEVARYLDAGSDIVARPHHAIVAPHAGYVYSGAIAGRVFAATTVPRRVVVLSPNHTGRGARAALWPRGSFVLPGDEVPVDEDLGRRLLDALAAAPLVTADHEAHRHEHALEVELPFVRARRADAVVTPLVLGGLGAADCVAIGEALAAAVDGLGEPVLVVASSDLSHYLPDEVTRRVDQRAIAPVLALDPERLYRVVEDEDITMCGVMPVTAALAYARACGARAGTLLAYGTSADAFGDTTRVVGYAGISID